MKKLETEDYTELCIRGASFSSWRSSDVEAMIRVGNDAPGDRLVFLGLRLVRRIS
jgi:hypothetical protein